MGTLEGTGDGKRVGSDTGTAVGKGDGTWEGGKVEIAEGAMVGKALGSIEMEI